ncbi:TfuA-like protein [Bradyrhizobium sp. JYMT SZCCT0428]|uniref:TfuA-like protein n=1 Tax=Bradyrhizobium sp. JYMT SZCCT0428 TaxID=2807673 RepID=UPI001BA69104|nr:TfuA-like protein [Bradyrhizobium sp. JYMT SZCCT0428]MBR1153714.1 hypothetical protein [Bradyrhizobium sp. JYMT SZCCT0428]
MPPPSKSAHSTAVFLGPSLPIAAAEKILPADYFPPAARGDIYRIVASGVTTIVLVDGVFHGTQSVWQREILDALGEGIEVFGASSMGALRAAELNLFGMVGHGTIFEWYKDGLIDGDDEVALLHGPKELEFCALSEPLVNIRRTLQNAVHEQCMTDDQARQLLDYTKRTYYPERSYRHLLTCPALQSWPDRGDIEQYVLTRAIDQKTLDTIGVLRRCAERQKVSKPAAVMLEEPRYDIWRLERLCLTGFSCGSAIFSGSYVLCEAAKEPLLVAEMQAVLSGRAFVMDLARRKQLSIPNHLLEFYTRRWEETLDITPGPDWLRANGLTQLSYRRLLAQHFLIDWLVDQDAGCWGQPPRERREIVEQPASGCMVISPESTPKGDADPTGLVVRMPQRRLLADWARESCISCPSDVLEKYIGRCESATVSAGDGERFQITSDEIDASDDSPADCALTEWMMEKGPRHYGLDWCFESSFLEELQITGLAAKLIAKARNG